MNNTDDEESLKLTTVEIEIKKDINPKNYQFEITSDNFLSGKPPFLNKENYISEISRIHCALLKNNVDISLWSFEKNPNCNLSCSLKMLASSFDLVEDSKFQIDSLTGVSDRLWYFPAILGKACS